MAYYSKAMELRKDLPTAQVNILEVICYDKKDYVGQNII
jgi:hypothetical protein